eukprot:TRINITY_DN4590_c0_g2_i2.p1 TRINITY_DN4590_c0_g2~~TRINITY_DN4590_c0_g2_i2.p1  ORF type:complete len:190 (+),score=21.90 TRINITY_DN4590_c0_g2_i2:73-642(+)
MRKKSQLVIDNQCFKLLQISFSIVSVQRWRTTRVLGSWEKKDNRNDRTLMTAVTSRGACRVGKWIGLHDECLKPSVIVVASVLVGLNGGRVGKGKGLGDLEYGIMREMGWIDGSEIVATTVHECQVVDQVPLEELSCHDVPVDIIITPECVIRTQTTIPKPKRVYWENLSAEYIQQISVLKHLRMLKNK